MRVGRLRENLGISGTGSAGQTQTRPAPESKSKAIFPVETIRRSYNHGYTKDVTHKNYTKWIYKSIWITMDSKGHLRAQQTTTPDGDHFFGRDSDTPFPSFSHQEWPWFSLGETLIKCDKGLVQKLRAGYITPRTGPTE